MNRIRIRHRRQAGRSRFELMDGNEKPAGILPQNIAFHGDGSIAVELWPQWAAMLKDLPTLGEIILVTRNQDAMLSQRTEFPLLIFTEDETIAISPRGEIQLDFRQWIRAHVIETPRPCGHSWVGIEFLDASGNGFQRVCLTAASDWPEFQSWLEAHQADGEDSGAPLAQESEAAPQSALPLDHPPKEAAGDLRVIAVLEEAGQRGLALQATVFHAGARHAAWLAPAAGGWQRDWRFFGSTDICLHLRPAGIARTHLEVRGQGPSRPPSLVAADPLGRRLLSLAPCPSDGAEWAGVLSAAGVREEEIDRFF